MKSYDIDKRLNPFYCLLYWTFMPIARELSNICPYGILVIIVETFALVPNSYLQLRYVEFRLVFVETDGMHQHSGTTVVFKC